MSEKQYCLKCGAVYSHTGLWALEKCQILSCGGMLTFTIRTRTPGDPK